MNRFRDLSPPPVAGIRLSLVFAEKSRDRDRQNPLFERSRARPRRMFVSRARRRYNGDAEKLCFLPTRKCGYPSVAVNAVVMRMRSRFTHMAPHACYFIHATLFTAFRYGTELFLILRLNKWKLKKRFTYANCFFLFLSFPFFFLCINGTTNIRRLKIFAILFHLLLSVRDRYSHCCRLHGVFINEVLLILSALMKFLCFCFFIVQLDKANII